MVFSIVFSVVACSRSFHSSFISFCVILMIYILNPLFVWLVGFWFLCGVFFCFYCIISMFLVSCFF